jgi:hypothetical protein
VSELDEAWAQALAAAAQRANTAGRTDVAEYLRLRTSNDLLRQTSIEWLLTTFTVLAGQANREGASLQIVTEDGHRFRVGHSTMVGRVLRLNLGVRSISIEAGWPRVPGDGFIRGGGLAWARISHRGKSLMNQELSLERSNHDNPRWMLRHPTAPSRKFLEADIKHHLTKLLSENYR